MASDYNTTIIEEFRANQGRVGGPWAGTTLLLLHYVGARSGVERVTPLAYSGQADGRFAIWAANGGSTAHPAWYHNLRAHPRITVEVGSQTFTVLAEELDGTARAELWPRLVAQYPSLGEAQAKTTRQFPVFLLTRADAPGLPPAVDRAAFEAEVAALRVREKEHTREGLSVDDLDAFLAGHRNLIVAGTRADGRPHVTPTWFYWDGERFYVSTTRGRLKYAVFRRDPRAQLVLDDPARLRAVLIPATVEIREHTAAQLPRFAAIREKYGMDEIGDDEHLESLIAEGRVLLAITPDGPPTTWTCWGFG